MNCSHAGPSFPILLGVMAGSAGGMGQMQDKIAGPDGSWDYRHCDPLPIRDGTEGILR